MSKCIFALLIDNIDCFNGGCPRKNIVSLKAGSLTNPVIAIVNENEKQVHSWPSTH